MNKNKLLNRAVEIAANAHLNLQDKNGDPYIGHIFRVMNMGKTMDEKICGALHDLIEDTNWTFEKLEKEGFPEEIISALKCLTKESEDENYDHFISRISKNALAVRVKINDLIDNLDVKRFTVITEKDMNRTNKYLKAYRQLIEK